MKMDCNSKYYKDTGHSHLDANNGQDHHFEDNSTAKSIFAGN